MADHHCPVCGYPGFVEPPWDGDNPSYDICPSCGVEFGYHDSRPTLDERRARQAELRQEWLLAGCPWRGAIDKPPRDWDPKAQLAAAGLASQGTTRGR